MAKGSFPHYGVPIGTEFSPPLHSKDVSKALSHEAAEREMALMRALSGPSGHKPGLPPIKAPVVPSDFAERIAQLDNTIYQRGVAVDRAKLVEVGKARFQELLERDYRVREFQRIGGTVDLTSWPQVQRAFQELSALVATAVPPRKSVEISAGQGKDREAAAAFNDFRDLWKALGASEPVALRNCLKFHDRFVSLVFGQSLLDRLEEDGRAHSHFFCGGRGRRVELFNDWLEVLQGQLVSVTLPDTIWHLVAWLAGEQNPKPDTLDLARVWFKVRCPSAAQLRVVQSVLDGFLLGHSAWTLWEFVGRATRTVQAQEQLAEWRNQFAKSYRHIEQFHDELRAAFYKPIGMNAFEAHQQFDAAGHRVFIHRTIQGLLDLVSAVTALAIETTCADALVARFQDRLLLEVNKPPSKTLLRESVQEQLSVSFLDTAFEVEITEVAIQ